MNHSLAQFLNQLNTQFYRENATSFSSTRSSAWEGWQRVLQVWECSLGKGFSETLGKEVSEQASDTLSVLDVACGNRRFEQFLGEQMPDQRFSVVGVDSCEELLPDSSTETISPALNRYFVKADLVSGLLADGDRNSANEQAAHVASNETSAIAHKAPASNSIAHKAPADSSTIRNAPAGNSTILLNPSSSRSITAIPGLSTPLPEDSFNLVVSFGFMHHIPGAANRLVFLESLAAQCAPGALLAISFWRFMTHDQLAKKAVRTTQEACEFHAITGLESGDYLLGWSDTNQSYRYCHSFEQEEIDDLVHQLCSRKLAGVPGDIALVDRFVADGRTHNLNEYVVFRVG